MYTNKRKKIYLMKKKIIIVSIIVCVIFGIIGTGYFFFKKSISDKTVKARLLTALGKYGDVTIDSVHMDIIEGITIDNLSFSGTSEDLKGKSIVIPKIILKHNPQSLIKGNLNIINAIAISPELTLEKPTDIWTLLDAIKSNFDKTEIPPYVEVLNQGIEVRNLKVHIKENPQTNNPEIKLSGIDISFQPYAGSFKDIIIKGNIDDEFMGNYSFSMRLYPSIPKLDIEASANNIVLSESFLNRFPYIGKALWNKYKPNGKINVTCRTSLDNQNKQKYMDYIININLNGIEVMYADWPFLIYNLNGAIELNTKKLYLKGIVGYIKSGDSTSQAEFKGEFDLHDTKKTFVMTIPNLFISEELLKNIPKFGEQIRAKTKPTGLVDLTLQYNTGENQEDRCFLAIDCKDLNFNFPDFPLPVSHVNGQFRLCNNIMVFKNANGFLQCGDQTIFTEMNGIYNIKTGRKIFNFHAPNLSITESFLKNLPFKNTGEKLWNAIHPAGKADININFQGFDEKKSNDYSIDVNLKDCEITENKYKIHLRGIEGRLEINKDCFVSKHMEANCCGGHVEGAISINTTSEPYQYEGELSFSRVILEELAIKVTNTEKPWSGLLYGRIKYRGKGTDQKNFYAEGQLNINEGYLSDVPVILSVFNVLNLNIPRKESFNNAQVKYIVKDGIIHVDDGRIYSDTIELNGRGDIELNGNLHLNVVAGFGKGVFSQIPIVGKVFDFVVGGVRKQLTMVEIKGTFLKPESHLTPFKPLTHSIKNMFDILPKEEHITSTNQIESKEKEERLSQ